MFITTKKTTIALVTSAALSAGFALSPMMVSAETSAMVSSGYMQLAEADVGASEGATKHQKNVTDDVNGATDDTDTMTEEQSTGKSATEHQKSVTEDEMDSDNDTEMKKDHKAKSDTGMDSDMDENKEEGDTGIKK